MRLLSVQPWAFALASLLGAPLQSPPARNGAGPAGMVPAHEVLAYRVEWRLVHAGNARLTWSASESSGSPGWQSELALESVGLVSRLYKVNNKYSSMMSAQLCVQNSLLHANEGSRRRETMVNFDSERLKASYLERDLVKNTVVGSHEIDIRPCEHDVIGALYQLRSLPMGPGQAVQIPVSDGKKTVMARVEAQERENVKIGGETYKTVRYEAFLFNNVLYRRRGRLFVWLTDDERRLPVQIRVRLPFYIGTVTLQLQKENKT